MILPEGGRDPGDAQQLCGPAGQGHAWTHFVYYANDTAYEQTSSLGEVPDFYYDFFRRRTEVVFPDGAKEAYIFDRVGNIIRMETGRGVVHSYEYEDGTRNRTHELDGFGRATTAQCDARGDVTQRTDRLGKSETWTYNTFSQPTSQVDRNGHRREWRDDGRGNLLEELAVADGRRPGVAIECRRAPDPGR